MADVLEECNDNLQVIEIVGTNELITLVQSELLESAASQVILVEQVEVPSVIVEQGGQGPIGPLGPIGIQGIEGIQGIQGEIGDISSNPTVAYILAKS